MTYDNNSNKITFLSTTGSAVIAGGYKFDISTLLDSTTKLGSTLSDADEIVVVRKFDHSTISPSTTITADEAWSVWTLPNSNGSGSSMYTLNGSTITFSQTASDYTWTAAQSGRAADVTLPVLASDDTIYVVRKTYSLARFINWATGSRITKDNLNMQADQMMYINQELLDMYFNMHKFNPAIGQASGICPLNSSGTVPAANIDGDSINLQTELGVQGAGTSTDKVRLNLDTTTSTNSGLATGANGVRVDVVDSVTSTDTDRPLSAYQGKLLNDSVVSISRGITWKGAFDLTNASTYAQAYPSGSPAAGDTVTHSGSGGGAHASWEPDGEALTVVQWSMYRWSGTAWQQVEEDTYLHQDGSVALGADWDAGSTRTISAKTVANTATQKELVTAEWVRTHTGASSDNLTLDKLTDVYITDTSPAAEDVLVRNAANNAWEPMQLENSFGAGEKIITTGSSVAALGDVGAAASGGGDTGKALVWDGDSWEPTAISSAYYENVIGGTGNGAANEQSAVSTALNHATWGFLVDDGEAASTIRSLSGRGRNYLCTDEVWIRDAAHRTLKDVKLSYTLGTTNHTRGFNTSAGNNEGFINTASQANLAARTYETQLVANAKTGDHFVTVANGEGAKLRVGQRVDLVYGSSEDKGSWVATIKSNRGSRETDATNQTIYQGEAGFIITNIETTNDDVEYVWLDKPVRHYHKGDPSTAYTNLRVYGTDGSSASTEPHINECRDLVFENVTFRDNLGQIFSPSKSGYGGSEYDGTTTAFDFTSGATYAEFVIPASHGLVAGGGFRIADLDVKDKLAVSSSTNKKSSANGIFTVLSMQSGGGGTDKVRFTLGNSATGLATGSSTAESMSYVILSHHTGCNMQLVNKLVFRNCTFENWNQHALRIVGCNDVLIEDCTFRNCRGAMEDGDGHPEAAIMFDNHQEKSGSANVVIRGCKFHNCGVGIGSTSNLAGAGPYSPVVNNLSIEKCYFHCEAGIHFPSAVDGKVSVKDCTFIGNVNPERVHIGLLGDAINFEGGVSDLTVSGCSITGFNELYSTAVSWDSTAFWGEGNGVDRLDPPGSTTDTFATMPWDPYRDIQGYSANGTNNTGDSGRHWTAPSFKRGIEARVFINFHEYLQSGWSIQTSGDLAFYAEGSTSPANNLGCRVNIYDNTISVWGRNAIRLASSWNLGRDNRHHWFTNWSIHDNYLVASKWTIELQHDCFGTNSDSPEWRSIVSDFNISNNRVSVDRIAKSFPNNPTNSVEASDPDNNIYTEWTGLNKYGTKETGAYSSSTEYQYSAALTACAPIHLNTGWVAADGGSASDGYESWCRFKYGIIQGNLLRAANTKGAISGCGIGVDCDRKNSLSLPTGNNIVTGMLVDTVTVHNNHIMNTVAAAGSVNADKVFEGEDINTNPWNNGWTGGLMTMGLGGLNNIFVGTFPHWHPHNSNAEDDRGFGISNPEHYVTGKLSQWFGKNMDDVDLGDGDWWSKDEPG